MSRVRPDSAREARRIERMASAYGLLQPTDAELAAKRREALPRALSRRSASGRGLRLGLAAALLSGGVFAAASGGLVLDRPAWSLWPHPVEPSSAAPKQAPPGAHSVPQPSVAVPAASESPVSAPAEALHPSAQQGTGQVRMLSAPAALPEKSALAERSALPTREPTEGWSVVAEALRSKDAPRAREALGKLSQSPDPSTRDAADLARAQLDVASGSVSSARVVFERVAREGATAQLKAQAERSLRQLEGK